MTSTLLMPFLDESENFTNGFVCGQIWQKISEGECFAAHLFQSANKRQVEMICESFGVPYVIEKVDADWSTLTVRTINS